MIPPLRSARSRAARLAQLGPLLLLAAGLLAYRTVLLDGLGWPSRSGFEDWLFAPEQKGPLPVFALAGWLLWRRRARLRSLPSRIAPRTTLALLALGAGLLVWGLLHPGEHLLLLSLAANLLAFAAAAKGSAGCRALRLPALVLLLGAPIPAPIRDELVWQLQLWATSAAAWGLRVAGYDVSQSGILLWKGDYTFEVIASCSGLRGMQVLTLVAVVIRERFASAGRRQWLLVLAAPALALALNLARILVVVVVASSGEPRPPGTGISNHALQGLAWLLTGGGLLYAFARWLAGPAWRAARSGPPSAPAASGTVPAMLPKPDSEVQQHAMQTLDRFVRDFRDELAGP